MAARACFEGIVANETAYNFHYGNSSSPSVTGHTSPTPSTEDESQDDQCYIFNLRVPPPQADRSSRNSVIGRKRAVLNTKTAGEIFRLRGHSPQIDSQLCGPTHNLFSGRSVLVSQLYGVSPKAVRDIWNKRTWRHATRHMWTEEEILMFKPSTTTRQVHQAIRVEEKIAAKVSPISPKPTRPSKTFDLSKLATHDLSHLLASGASTKRLLAALGDGDDDTTCDDDDALPSCDDDRDFFVLHRKHAPLNTTTVIGANVAEELHALGLSSIPLLEECDDAISSSPSSVCDDYAPSFPLRHTPDDMEFERDREEELFRRSFPFFL